MSHPTQIDRRGFLALGGAGLAAGLFSPISGSAGPGAKAAAPMAPADFKQRLDGPVMSIPTCFTSDFAVDYEGIRRMIDRAVKAGVRAVGLTAGDSQYDRLSQEEIRRLTRLMVETVAGRAVTIAATGPWWTRPAVEHARFAESAGADAIQVLFPPEASDEDICRHYREVARATRLGIVVHGAATVPLVRRLAEIDAIVAMKTEFTVEQTAALFQALEGRWNLFQGGQKSPFLACVPYGMHAYYSTYATFRPDYAMDFWSLVQAGRIRKAGDWVLKYDIPLFARFSHAFWRATIEHFGVASRYLRPPDPSFTDREMEEVRRFWNDLGVKPA